PNLAFILSASSPLGSPPPLGLNVFQKKLWLACPPPLLRTAVRISAGTLSKSLIKSSTDFDFKSACPSTAPFNFVTYVLWCFVRSEEHTSELQSRFDLVCRLLLEKKNLNS